MKAKYLFLSLIVSGIFAGPAIALTKAEYDTQKNQVTADYKVNRDKCGSLQDNAKDICMSQAKGAEKVAKAELEAQYKPSPKNTREVAMIQADTAFDTAKEKCDDLAGNAKDVCVKDAKAAHVKAKEDAKVAKEAADTSGNRTEKVNEARKDASAETREANFKAAKERCDSLAGNAKDACQKDAQARFGM